MSQRDYAWVQGLPDHAIEEILTEMHDLKGERLRKALVEEVWRRYAQPISVWPDSDVPGVEEICPLLARAEHKGDKIEGHAPNKKLHANLKGFRGRIFSCTCGWFNGPGSRARAYSVQRLRSAATVSECPFASIGVATRYHLIYVSARPQDLTVDSVTHAITRCICGWRPDPE